MQIILYILYPKWIHKGILVFVKSTAQFYNRVDNSMEIKLLSKINFNSHYNVYIDIYMLAYIIYMFIHFEFFKSNASQYSIFRKANYDV